ncbi:MAG TPA: hypothetical protein VFH06_05420 [Candidatus Saccharimonadales bacterium]|nr:hypothetical protein [Candidatus Saccharimonadales bacterium]
MKKVAVFVNDNMPMSAIDREAISNHNICDVLVPLPIVAVLDFDDAVIVLVLHATAEHQQHMHAGKHEGRSDQNAARPDGGPRFAAHAGVPIRRGCRRRASNP